MPPNTAKPKPPIGDDGLTQSERFIKAAQEIGTDDDPERFADRVRKIAGGQSRTAGSIGNDSRKGGAK